MRKVDTKYTVLALEALFAILEVRAFPAVVAEIAVVVFVGGDAVVVEFAELADVDVRAVFAFEKFLAVKAVAGFF